MNHHTTAWIFNQKWCNRGSVNCLDIWTDLCRTFDAWDCDLRFYFNEYGAKQCWKVECFNKMGFDRDCWFLGWMLLLRSAVWSALEAQTPDRVMFEQSCTVIAELFPCFIQFCKPIVPSLWTRCSLINFSCFYWIKCFSLNRIIPHPNV